MEADLAASVSNLLLLTHVLPLAKWVLLVELLYHVFTDGRVVCGYHDIIHVEDDHSAYRTIFVVVHHERHIHSGVLEADLPEKARHFLPPGPGSIWQAVDALQDL